MGLLQALCVRVVVPAVGWDEVVVHAAGEVGAAEVAAATWLERADAKPEPGLLWILDIGEAAAIPIAERLCATPLCNERRAGAEYAGEASRWRARSVCCSEANAEVSSPRSRPSRRWPSSRRCGGSRRGERGARPDLNRERSGATLLMS